MTEMDNVSIKVIEDARSEAKRNITEAEEKAAGIISEAAGKIKEMNKAASAGADGHYKKTLEMEVFKARSELEQKVLLTKLEIIDSIIAGAREKLSRLDKKGWEKFLGKMAKELDIAEGSYVIGKMEKALDDKVISVIKGIKPGNTPADFDRGLKITGGKAEILLSPENYLEMDVEDLRMEIASYIFDGGDR
jgi:vacuolar-type H+-ATPase subunit E/Vma4